MNNLDEIPKARRPFRTIVGNALYLDRRSRARDQCWGQCFPDDRRRSNLECVTARVRAILLRWSQSIRGAAQIPRQPGFHVRSSLPGRGGHPPLERGFAPTMASGRTRYVASD